MKIQPDIAAILGLSQLPEQHRPPQIRAHAERSAQQQAHDRREFMLWLGALLALGVALALGVEIARV